MPHLPPDVPRLPSKKPPKCTVGYVYLIRMEGVYKIGHTVSWHSRRNGFSGMPFKCVLLALLYSKNMVALEMDLHKRFSQKRLQGEWFSLTPADVQEILDHPNRVEIPTKLEDLRRRCRVLRAQQAKIERWAES